MKSHIWGPLGMNSTAFRLPEAQPAIDPVMDMVVRSPTGELIPSPESGPVEPTDDMGGSGSYSCASDYIKVLISILKNDGKLLKPETVDIMFKPHLEDRKYLRAILSIPEFYSGFASGVPPGQEFDHGLGGVVAMEETPGRRSKGTLTWGGLPNLFWVCYPIPPYNCKRGPVFPSIFCGYLFRKSYKVLTLTLIFSGSIVREVHAVYSLYRFSHSGTQPPSQFLESWRNWLGSSSQKNQQRCERGQRLVSSII